MGMTGVEIVLACEEEFGVDLPDAEVGECRTPAMLIDIIWRLLEHRGASRCGSQVAFHRLRKAITAAWQAPRDAVRPDTPIRALLGSRHPVIAWTELADALGHRIRPPLVPPRWLVWSIQITLVATLTATTYVAVRGQILPPLWWVAIGVGAVGVLLIAGDRLMNAKRICLPDGIRVRDLFPSIPKIPEDPWTREIVADMVRRIVTEHLCLNPGDYHEEADFVRDLGVD